VAAGMRPLPTLRRKKKICNVSEGLKVLRRVVHHCLT
jgi:hypothetical protein